MFLFFQILTVNGGVVKRGDIESDNGLVHVVDRVLFPPASGDLMETLKSDPENRFTTLIKALKATKLDKEIKNYLSEYSTLKLFHQNIFTNILQVIIVTKKLTLICFVNFGKGFVQL
jgi:uncharacterized surface protein with fasciclin (FAS1) repeats